MKVITSLLRRNLEGRNRNYVGCLGALLSMVLFGALGLACDRQLKQGAGIVESVPHQIAEEDAVGSFRLGLGSLPSAEHTVLSDSLTRSDWIAPGSTFA